MIEHALKNRESWLAKRREGVTATDAATIVGENPYRSALECWAIKTERMPEPDLSGNMKVQFGKRFEGPIADAYSEATGAKLHDPGEFTIQQSEPRPWMLCTVDRYARNGGGRTEIVEIKTAGSHMAAEWEDGPPLMYQIQLQHQLAVTNFHVGTIVVLIGGQDLRWFRLERDDEFIKNLCTAEFKFWACCAKGVEPEEVDGSESCARALRKLHPDDNGQTSELPDAAVGWDEELQRVKGEIAVLETVEQHLKNRFAGAIGDATFGSHAASGIRYSWKTTEKKAYEVGASKTRTLRKVRTSKK